ncbi:hypothetical protein BGX27_000548 [Mortierella sp. AM989]|nr:hypothetical protein BGX27_000548 [Mortierella sp. AM989]
MTEKPYLQIYLVSPLPNLQVYVYSEVLVGRHIRPAVCLSELSKVDFVKINTYDEVTQALLKEDLADPVAYYLMSIVMPYSHYFKFHNKISQDLNEREAFASFTWSFIRGALTMMNIGSRSLEVLITGVYIHAESKVILDEEFGQFGKFERKVDLTFYSGKYELSNRGFKIPDAPEMDVKLQNRKNIHLNRAIMESHRESSGLKMEILYFDYQGRNGSMFALFLYQDIFVSKYIQSVELPTTMAGLKRFLRGDALKLLFNYVDD